MRTPCCGGSGPIGFRVLGVTWEHAVRLQDLPFPVVSGRAHRDPFDRLIAAQALTERIPVVTRDPALGAYGLAVVW